MSTKPTAEAWRELVEKKTVFMAGQTSIPISTAEALVRFIAAKEADDSAKDRQITGMDAAHIIFELDEATDALFSACAGLDCDDD